MMRKEAPKQGLDIKALDDPTAGLLYQKRLGIISLESKRMEKYQIHH
jgi:hypothetical protein